MSIARNLKFGLLGFSALMLVGCAHPDLIDLGATEQTVLTELGMPDSKIEQADGTVQTAKGHGACARPPNQEPAQ